MTPVVVVGHEREELKVISGNLVSTPVDILRWCVEQKPCQGGANDSYCHFAPHVTLTH
jgi:hypothetical protein